jgi:hypothetical protein
VPALNGEPPTVWHRAATDKVPAYSFDAVIDDGSSLWLRTAAEDRRLFEKAEFYQAWATEDRTGFHYCVTKNLSSAAC